MNRRPTVLLNDQIIIPERKSFKNTGPTLMGIEMNRRPTVLLNDQIRKKFNMNNRKKDRKKDHALLRSM